jgi:class 3 adenylate cyclase
MAVMACRKCGTETMENARFCHGCGSAVIETETHAEYKQVTVLFADVVHSMDIAAAVGAERLREIMAELADRCAAVVHRYDGIVGGFTGDGIMAVFGAPKALEDHAIRACLAALGAQEEAKRLGDEVRRRDGLDLRLRVGLNSGQVIAGEIGSGPFGYTAIGEQVGMAQRMESVAPPGGVMLSASTARLVDGAAALGEPELVRIKGIDNPVAAHLLGVGEPHRAIRRVESNLVGRRWELSAVEGLLDRAIDGQGSVVAVVGPPGIGKSRLVREVAAMASRRGVEVFTGICESHTSQVAFHLVAPLLRAAMGVEDLDGPAARDRVRAQAPDDADPEDLMLLDDLLGIADPEVPLPDIEPEARRRRLTALVNSAWLVREFPAVYVVEDAHWIDDVSQSMVAEFLTVSTHTPSLVLITHRPEYRGALTQVAGAQTIALAPLTDSETAALVLGLVGPDPSLGGLADAIAARAAGNPFFAEEIVRELAERGVLRGEPGAYISAAEAAEVNVPATLQATIAARIDRLDPTAKRTLSAAAVVGSRFGLDLLAVLGIEPAVADLMAAELIHQVSFGRYQEFVFYHPLIRAVAYETQLKSDRAELHRRVAAAIEAREPASADENAALIAEHLEAAGDLAAAYAWHMRAGAWLTNRDIAAGLSSWQRARGVADALPDDHPNRSSMRIAPRTLICGSAWRVAIGISGTPFEELRELCAATRDTASLAVGMTGLVMEQTIASRLREASRLAAEHVELLEAIGDPTLTVGLSFAAIVLKHETGEPGDMLRWSQRIIDLAAGDPAKGNVLLGSPLAMALAWRGVARWALGRGGWREDFDEATAVARRTDPMSKATVVAYKYALGVANGVLTADQAALHEIDDAVQIAERSGDAYALALVTATLGIALMHADQASCEHAVQVLSRMRELSLQRRFTMTMVPVFDMYTSREQARRGDYDGALPSLRSAVGNLFSSGAHLWCIPGTAALVETLLDRCTNEDLAEAEAAIARLAEAPTDDDLVARDVMVLRLRALLAHAHGDEVAYRDLRDRYRAMATSLGFEGHMKWAEAMA